MLATAKGFYNGSEIVLDSPTKLKKGQEVMITYIISQPTDNINFSKSAESTDSIVDSLLGAIPDNGKSLEEYQEERLSKYADFN